MADDPTFAHSASGLSNVYDTSASGLGLSPAYLANTSAAASASSGGGTTGGGSSNTLANRPIPADALNEFFFATDQMVLYFSDGSVWIRVSEPAGAAQLWYGNAASPPGYVAYDGSSLPSSTGIYADLFAHLGTLVLPDTRGRMMVVRGTHPDVDAIGDTDGLGLADRTPRHNSTNAATLPSHTHSGTTGNDKTDHSHSGSTGGQSQNHQHGLHKYEFVTDGGSHWADVVSTASGNVFDSIATDYADRDHTHGFTTGGVNQNHQHDFATGNPNQGAVAVGGSIGPGGTRPVDTPSYLVFGLLVAKL